MNENKPRGFLGFWYSPNLDWIFRLTTDCPGKALARLRTSNSSAVVFAM